MFASLRVDLFLSSRSLLIRYRNLRTLTEMLTHKALYLAKTSDFSRLVARPGRAFLLIIYSFRTSSAVFVLSVVPRRFLSVQTLWGRSKTGLPLYKTHHPPDFTSSPLYLLRSAEDLTCPCFPRPRRIRRIVWPNSSPRHAHVVSGLCMWYVGVHVPI